MAPSSQEIGRVGWDMLKQQCGDRDTQETVILSPLSITIALGMLAGAADTRKKHDLCTKLGLQNAEELESVLHPLHNALCGNVKGGPLALANGVFTDTSVTLYSKYQEFLAGFNAEFTQYPSLEGAVDEINKWISDNTRGLIQDMLSAALLRNCHLALVNAIGFKGTWKTQFDRSNTRKETFFVTPNETKDVNMMFLHQQRISFLETSTYKAAQLPYQLPASYPQTSLLAYLPNEGKSVGDVLDEIADHGSSISRFSEGKYHKFGFPKFEIESSFSLVDTLEKLGYPIGGVYPNMADGPNQVQTILHQALVKVDEEGTEAAAATAVLMTRSIPVAPKILIFNRPFVFAIVSDKPKAVLFAGVYSGK
ncbi:proteinase inhibitor I4 [Pochonia chlamydosporia 170]|uniref:Proteinase inhibitor I4 n=1 Tax=Pochonia chlamydosporia 170 TaxID=1380566 RepID=A0A179F1P7_METCM|nr:proteinase inhibitor I4 [Pochonia chlamydosporia 170]OAQ59394.1 proteinase inhibitor I4 [Pochonia chlamydosporia 170]